METRRIELPVATVLRIQSRSGKVHVIAEPRDDVAAETDQVESFVDSRERALVVRSARGGSKPLIVRCPVDTDIIVGTQSGSVKVEGKLGEVRVTTMSGNIEVEDAEEADLRSMSGGLTVGVCRGSCRMNAVSGAITAREIDTAYANSVSGSIRIERLAGDIRARTVSGSIQVHASGAGAIAVKTVSGKVHIELPPGTEPSTAFRTRGSVRCDFPPGRDCRIEAASLSGSIEVVPA